MKKAFDQTVRDLKREVNKKVLKVPGMEQKILDATSNEPWGPHGSLLADIAEATRNYYEYQIIMNVIWKRINDTGKNWRHVYKSLTVLDYLVAHGSERIIDDIREHAYQISTLSNFQYIDSKGRDQGNNVRRKSQSLVALVNDKERIEEARQKAFANKDKYRSNFSTGGTHRPSSYSSRGGYGDHYDDDRYGNRDGDRNGYGREREWGYKDEDRYGRDRDSYSRDGDRYGRESDENYGKDSYREEEYRRSNGNDDYPYRARNRSVSRERDRPFDDEDQYSSRSGGARADDHSQDGRRLEHKLSEQNVDAPPSYEEAINEAKNRPLEESNGGNGSTAARKSSSPSVPRSSFPGNVTQGLQGPETVVASVSVPIQSEEINSFDEFDPRGSFSASAPATSNPEMDLFGSLTSSDPINSLALVPVDFASTSPEAEIPANSSFGTTNFVALSSVSSVISQPNDNPFGDPPFKATQEGISSQRQSSAPAYSFQTHDSTGGAEALPPMAPKIEKTTSLDFGGILGDITYTPSMSSGLHHSFSSPAFLAPEMPIAHTGVYNTGSLPPQPVSAANVPSPAAQPFTTANFQTGHSDFLQHSGPPAPLASQETTASLHAAQHVSSTNVQKSNVNLLPDPGLSSPFSSETAAIPGLQSEKPQPMKKFEPKSTVWADTLNRGLVNLNISGPKINPHADIGVDFDSINRKERRDEKKSSTALVTSTITMGKAMGAGSGIGRVGASGLAPSSNPMIGSNMGIRMGMAGGAGMGMGAYGGSMNQQTVMGMGMNVGMSMGQGMPMRPPNGMLPGGAAAPGVGYNPMMNTGYGSQQMYGGGYR
ncbi:clathrin interactor EPSIN 3-like [Typha angustifolia]|uniref:clathrin interactor EPSIN 3-like n=1 Tax=Typha angustifolia TaxID=59011 RepID=UPI003C2B77C1